MLALGWRKAGCLLDSRVPESNACCNLGTGGNATSNAIETATCPQLLASRVHRGGHSDQNQERLAVTYLGK